MTISPTIVYAVVGFVVGTVLGFIFAGSAEKTDLLIGALFGLLIGIFLAFARQRLWERK